MSEIYVLTRLVEAGMTPIGACAMWGNIMAESTGVSNIAQRGMTKLSDAEYTKAADSGTIDFIHDAVGYGFCQWTFYSRKQNLLNMAKSKGMSVGDETLQVEFLLWELQTAEYIHIWKVLCSANELYDATDIVCRQFERPAVNNVASRYNYAQEAFNVYGEQLKGLKTASAVVDKVEPVVPKAESKSKLTLSFSESLLIQTVLYNHQILTKADVDGIVGKKSAEGLLKFAEMVKASIE